MAKKKSRGPRGPIIPEMTPARMEEQKFLRRWKKGKSAPTFWDKLRDPSWGARETLGQAWGSPRVRYTRKRP
jgi:hypothetical protein